MKKVWRKYNMTTRRFPQVTDLAECEVCGKIGHVGDIIISWGMAINSAVCRECYNRNAEVGE